MNLLCVLVLALPLLGGCVVGSTTPSSPTGVADSGSDGRFEDELSFCVAEINRLRATVGKPPLTRSTVLETYAATAARVDGLARTAHQHARATTHGNLTALAENEVLFWSLSAFKSVRAIVQQGLADMWRQGEHGAHYRNLVGAHTQVGCGIFVNGDEVTVVQAFR